jgi:hypothetical protein
VLDWPSVWATVRTWWWVVPLTVLAGTAIMWVTESDLSVAPSSYVRLDRTYEPLDELGPLVVVGIDPAVLNPVPGEQQQLTVLQSGQFTAEIETRFGTDHSVLVSRTEPNFSISAFQREDRSSKFSFLTTGRPAFNLSCSEPTLNVCGEILDVYAEKLVSVRKEAASRGLSRTEALLRGVLEASPSLGDEARERIQVQLAAIDTARVNLAGDMQLVNESTTYEGSTVTTVEPLSYWFGALVGLAIGLLVLAQLGLSDRRIRGEHRLLRAVGPDAVAGTLGASADAGDVPIAAALLARAAAARTSGLRVVPVGPVDAAAVAARLGAHAGGARATAPLAAATLADLRSADGSGVVLAVEVGRSRIDDALEAWRAWERAGNPMLGVVLVARSGRTRA